MENLNFYAVVVNYLMDDFADGYIIILLICLIHLFFITHDNDE